MGESERYTVVSHDERRRDDTASLYSTERKSAEDAVTCGLPLTDAFTDSPRRLTQPRDDFYSVEGVGRACGKKKDACYSVFDTYTRI